MKHVYVVFFGETREKKSRLANCQKKANQIVEFYGLFLGVQKNRKDIPYTKRKGSL